MCENRQYNGVRCGQTGFDGRLYICEECTKKSEAKYPQGWRNVPGDVCKHGTYIGGQYGADYLCGQCESE